jgi:hypothetical protein
VRLRELLVRRLLILEPVEPGYVPGVLWPTPPGEEVLEDWPPIDIAGELESSIIITACRLLAPAPMTMGVSGNGTEEVDDGKGSERNVEGKMWVDCCIAGWNGSLVGVGRTLVGLPPVRDRIGGGGGEGDEGSEGNCALE